MANEEINELLVKGLFGPDKKIITTKELMDKEIVAQLNIIILKLLYPETTARELISLDYNGQTKYLEMCKARTKKLLQLVGTQMKTGLLFYKHIAHGEEIFETARKMFPDRNCYLVHSNHFQMNDKKFKSFEDIKPLIEKDDAGIVIANYQLASTGISIKNLHFLMFFASIKSYTSVLQSIGRGLRISNTKNKVLLIDVVDEFCVKRRKTIQQNYAVKHFQERFTIYNESQFDYKMMTINLVPENKVVDVYKTMITLDDLEK